MDREKVMYEGERKRGREKAGKVRQARRVRKKVLYCIEVRVESGI
jgi:hypothetical protein